MRALILALLALIIAPAPAHCMRSLRDCLEPARRLRLGDAALQLLQAFLALLLDTLGDVVVLMPILTSTAEEIDRIVDVLGASIEEVCAQ